MIIFSFKQEGDYDDESMTNYSPQSQARTPFFRKNKSPPSDDLVMLLPLVARAKAGSSDSEIRRTVELVNIRCPDGEDHNINYNNITVGYFFSFSSIKKISRMNQYRTTAYILKKKTIRWWF